MAASDEDGKDGGGTALSVPTQTIADGATKTELSLLRAALGSIEECIVLMDKEGRVLFANPPFLRRFGLESVAGMAISDVPSLAVATKLNEQVRRVFASKSSITDEGEYVGPTGPVRYEYTLSPILGPNDSVDGVAASVRERDKRGEEALRTSHSLLRGISDSTGDVIFAKDRDGRMLFANPAALRLIGKPLERVIGRTDAEFLEDKDAALLVMENDRRIMENGVPADVEEDVPLADGTRRTWLSHKMPHRDENGDVIGILGVASDITDQKLAWRRMSASYDFAAALGKAVTFDEVVQVAVNKGIEAVGATAGSLALLTEDDAGFEIVGWVGYPADMMKRWERFSRDAPIPLAECVQEGRPLYVTSQEERLARFPALAALNAEKGTRSSACMPLIVGGRTLGSIGLSFDHRGEFSAEHKKFMVSLSRQCAQAIERARLLEREQQARADAEHASRMKDEFLATLSHELRTPLNAILGWSNILAKGPSDDSTLRLGLATIERNARAQTRIIEDLLDMSRIISGKVRLEVQRTDLHAVLQAAVDTVRPTAEAKGVRLRTNLDPHAGPVSGDPSRLQQVFWNLLHNAIKFTPKGGRVDVRLERADSHIDVTVADNGLGIHPDFLDHVFDRFRQADSSTSRRHGGLGLGLSIVKQLVELHGGDVRATSAGVGSGASFTVALPRATAYASAPPIDAASRHPAAHDEVPSAANGDRPLDGIRVIVVDDEADARRVLKRILEDAGAVVRDAASSEEGIALMAGEEPDILISDIGMPNEDGYAFLRRVREMAAGDRRPDIPAIALTAYARSEDRVKALRAGYQSHVVKPVEAEELVAIVVSLSGGAKR